MSIYEDVELFNRFAESIGCPVRATAGQRVGETVTEFMQWRTTEIIRLRARVAELELNYSRLSDAVARAAIPIVRS